MFHVQPPVREQGISLAFCPPIPYNRASARPKASPLKTAGLTQTSKNGDSVLSNKRFQLTHSTLAIDFKAGKRWIAIPAGALIEVVAGPNGEGYRMVDVRWQSRPLVMFAIDLTAGGTEIHEHARAAGA